jgi:Zn-dependent M28 family amino/carboxypeptidase
MNLSYEVELLFTDAEDQNHSSKLYGAEAWVERQTTEEKNRTSAYIVVDMVGDAFLQLTHVYPGDAKLWSTISPLASAIGLVETKADCNGMFGRDVVNLSISTGVIDDHVPALNNGIRAIDLIDIRFGPDAEPFGGYWHTHEDTPDKVSAQSLADVGRLVEIGLRSGAWSTTITLSNTTTAEEDPVIPAPDMESETLETYVWMGSAALLSLLAALVFVSILSRAVDLKP